MIPEDVGEDKSHRFGVIFSIMFDLFQFRHISLNWDHLFLTE